VKRLVDEQAESLFRATVRDFFRNEILPEYPEWEAAGYPSRKLFRRAGELGMLGLQVPEEYGGAGGVSFRYNAILTEEMQAAGMALGGLRLHTDIVMPYLLRFGNEEQKRQWLPGMASGEVIAAIGMSEPEAGSDLRSIRTRARRDGSDYLIDGAKTFISSGSIADLLVTVVRTGDSGGRGDHSLLLVPTDSPGFTRGRRLSKIGLKAQDLAELSFDGVRVPATNLLGEEGCAFEYLTANLAQERLSLAINAQAAAEAALAMTVAYVQDRKAFGQTIGSFQNTKFELATSKVEIAAGRALVNVALEAIDAGELSQTDAAILKLYCTEMQGRVVDRCLQLFGGYGYIMDFPIAKAYTDARVTRIYGGSSEIMRVIVAKSLGL
jgi:alkylation response protein AidB-like acyl-CoA dehydrogenase